jgi:hypothetical protein
MIQPSDRLMDDVSQFRGKRPAPMSRPPMPTIKQPFLALRNMFLLLACAPPITLIGQRTMKAKEKLCIFQFPSPRGGQSLLMHRLAAAAQQDSHMSFPHSTDSSSPIVVVFL